MFEQEFEAQGKNFAPGKERRQIKGKRPAGRKESLTDIRFEKKRKVCLSEHG